MMYVLNDAKMLTRHLRVLRAKMNNRETTYLGWDMVTGYLVSTVFGLLPPQMSTTDRLPNPFLDFVFYLIHLLNGIHPLVSQERKLLNGT